MRGQPPARRPPAVAVDLRREVRLEAIELKLGDIGAGEPARLVGVEVVGAVLGERDVGGPLGQLAGAARPPGPAPPCVPRVPPLPCASACGRPSRRAEGSPSGRAWRPSWLGQGGCSSVSRASRSRPWGWRAGTLRASSPARYFSSLVKEAGPGAFRTSNTVSALASLTSAVLVRSDGSWQVGASVVPVGLLGLLRPRGPSRLARGRHEAYLWLLSRAAHARRPTGYLGR